MKAIYKNELQTYFSNMTGFIFCAFLLLFAGIYTMVLNLKQGYVEFEYVLGNMSFIYLIIVPIITMRVLSEEKKQKTDQLLYSLPVTTTEVILGKYLALLTVLLLPTLVICTYPLVLSAFGDINLLTCFAAIIGFFIMGAALLSIGLFVSSVTESQMTAAGLSFVLILINYYMPTLSSVVSNTAKTSLMGIGILLILFCILLYVMTKNSVVSIAVLIAGAAACLIVYTKNQSLFEGLIPDWMNRLSLFGRYYNFMYGTFNLPDLVFFLSVAAIFVFLSVQSLEKRRWS